MAETTIPIKDLKPGSFVMVEGEPCKVVSITKSKPGKHGSAKIRAETMGLFDNRRRFILKPGSATVDVPVIEKRKAQVISVSGNIVQLMDMQDYTTLEVSIPDEFKDKIASGKEGTEVIYWKISGRTLLREVK